MERSVSGRAVGNISSGMVASETKLLFSGQLVPAFRFKVFLLSLVITDVMYTLCYIDTLQK